MLKDMINHIQLKVFYRKVNTSWEHDKADIYSFGWIGNIKTQNAGLHEIDLCLVVQ